MKTVFLLNSKKQKLEVGMRVEAFVYGGCKTITTISGLRPKSNEIILKEGGYFKDVDEVKIIHQYTKGMNSAKYDVKNGWLVKNTMTESEMRNHLKIAIGASKNYIDGYISVVFNKK